MESVTHDAWTDVIAGMVASILVWGRYDEHPNGNTGRDHRRATMPPVHQLAGTADLDHRIRLPLTSHHPRGIDWHALFGEPRRGQGVE